MNLPSHAPLPPLLQIAISRFNSIDSSSTSDVTFAPIFSGDGIDNSPRIQPHFLPETRRPFHLDLPSCQISSPNPSNDLNPSATYHTPVYPGEDFFTLAAHYFPANDPEAKEILFRDQTSNQFPWLDNMFSIGTHTMSTISPNHNSKIDPTLLSASIPKRLVFRPTDSPYIISPKDEILGAILYDSLCRAYHRNPNINIPFDENLFAECINANEFAQLTSKSQAVIMANQTRSDPDWRWSAVRIFSKTQHKINENTLFSNWKACQTLALMHDAVVLFLGPVKKYQRIFDNQDRPDNIYVHASHTPFDLSDWCQKHLTFSHHIANDYTAFDQSQHGEAVVLERLKMERLSIPDHLINLHVHLKTNVSTQFGPLTCMRLTGEPGTYDDNTDYNLAVIFSEYAITNQAILVSGDDSLIDSIPPTRFNWPAIKPLLALRFKKEISPYALFCGYYVGPTGAVRSPLALFIKLAIAHDDGTMPIKIASYLAEFAVGHSLGQDLWTILPITHVPFQSACFDYFSRFAHSDLKSALFIGEIQSSLLAQIFPHLVRITKPVFAMLSTAQRRQTRITQPSYLPATQEYEGELLPSFNYHTNSHVNCSITHSIQDFKPATKFNRPFFRGASSPVHMAFNPSSAEAVAKFLKDVLSLATADKSGEGSGFGTDPDARVLHAPTLPSPSRTLSTPASGSSAGITLPFQFIWFDINGTETKTASLSIAANNIITSMTKPYRYASISTLEMFVTPMQISMKYPQTIDAIWCTADQTISDKDIMNTYGSQRITVGGPLSMNNNSTFPADLVQLNPVIKDSVSYSDTPRLCVNFYPNSDCVALGTKAPICATIFIRGTVHLSSPSATPTK